MRKGYAAISVDLTAGLVTTCDVERKQGRVKKGTIGPFGPRIIAFSKDSSDGPLCTRSIKPTPPPRRKSSQTQLVSYGIECLVTGLKTLNSFCWRSHLGNLRLDTLRSTPDDLSGVCSRSYQPRSIWQEGTNSVWPATLYKGLRSREAPEKFILGDAFRNAEGSWATPHHVRSPTDHWLLPPVKSS